MTDDALHEAAAQLLARDEEERGQDLTEWARNALSGDHLEGCASRAETCPACARETYEADARRIIDAYLAALGDAPGFDHIAALTIYDPLGEPVSVLDAIAGGIRDFTLEKTWARVSFRRLLFEASMAAQAIERERCEAAIERLIAAEWDYNNLIDSVRREAARSCLAAIRAGEPS